MAQDGRISQGAATDASDASDATAAIAGGDRAMSVADLTAPPEPRATSDRISLRRLVLIRWVAIAGQAVTLLTVHYGFGFRLLLLPCFAIVGCSVALNLLIGLFRRAATRLGEREAAIFLGYDLLQLGFLLYLTGGLENPFAILILAPVTVAATVLSQRPVIALAVFAVAAITLLAVWHMPLPWRASAAPPSFPPELVLGLWTALVLATVFIGGYTWSVAAEARRLRDAVAATQLALAREQRVSAVGALAAAAAHELGSPLATIAVVAKELVRELPADSPHGEDVQLLLSQSERCRQILAQLAHHPDEEGASPYTRLPISALVEAAGALYHDSQIRLIFAATGEAAADEPLVRRSPEIMHGLNNLIQNAVQFARREVSVTIHWDRAAVTVEIADDGPGFPAHLLGRLGEPYLSTRAGAANHMGLGIFIAQNLLERSGAELTFDNLVEGGAHVVILWKRANLEAEARPDAAGMGAVQQGNERQPA
jgi:two-component system sensor histidine kinase RegB